MATAIPVALSNAQPTAVAAAKSPLSQAGSFARSLRDASARGQHALNQRNLRAELVRGQPDGAARVVQGSAAPPGTKPAVATPRVPPDLVADSGAARAVGQPAPAVLLAAAQVSPGPAGGPATAQAGRRGRLAPPDGQPAGAGPVPGAAGAAKAVPGVPSASLGQLGLGLPDAAGTAPATGLATDAAPNLPSAGVGGAGVGDAGIGAVGIGGAGGTGVPGGDTADAAWASTDLEARAVAGGGTGGRAAPGNALLNGARADAALSWGRSSAPQGADLADVQGSAASAGAKWDTGAIKSASSGAAPRQTAAAAAGDTEAPVAGAFGTGTDRPGALGSGGADIAVLATAAHVPTPGASRAGVYGDAAQRAAVPAAAAAAQPGTGSGTAGLGIPSAATAPDGGGETPPRSTGGRGLATPDELASQAATAGVAGQSWPAAQATDAAALAGGAALAPATATGLAAPAPPGAAPAPASAGSAQASPASQLAAAAASVQLAANGQGHVTIQLRPDELGGVQVRIARGVDGSASVTLTVDKPETLASLQQDLAHLHQALDRAGLPVEARQVSLHLTPPVTAGDGLSTGSGGTSSGGGSEGGWGQGGWTPGGLGPGGGPGGGSGGGPGSGGRGNGGHADGGGQPGAGQGATGDFGAAQPSTWQRLGVNITA